MSILKKISGGRIIDPATNRDEIGDLYFRDGMIVDLPGTEEAEVATTIDATGLIVAPGLVDIHVHFREPGQTHKETIASGSRAAAAGGFTSVVCMPNTAPACDTPATIQFIRDIIARDAIVKVYPTGCITVDRKGKRLAPIGSLQAAGVVSITDDGDCVQNNELMRRAVEYAAMLDLPVLDHCQDASMTQGAVMNEGHWSMRLGLQGWPAAAEDLIVGRNIILSQMSGAHIHMQHISSANSIDLLRDARARNIRVTTEATPHHISLTDACLRNYDTRFKMNPPLRSDTDRLALIQGLVDGTIDCIATDHAPHADYEKDAEFDAAPFGIIGLETAFSVCYQTLVEGGYIDLLRLIELMTVAPARVQKIPGGTLKAGEPADIALIDLEASWTVGEDSLHGLSCNTPWMNQTLPARIAGTLVDGSIVYSHPEYSERWPD